MKMIYVDTSVIGSCYGKNINEDCLAFMALFERGDATMMYSETTKKEMSAAHKIKNKAEEIPKEYVLHVDTTPEIKELADRYIADKVLKPKHENDALHIATAIVYNADILISRNFRQMVNKNKKEKYNLINSQLGYKIIEIMSPGKFLQTYKL